jgi:hypothetical protein
MFLPYVQIPPSLVSTAGMSLATLLLPRDNAIASHWPPELPSKQTRKGVAVNCRPPPPAKACLSSRSTVYSDVMPPRLVAWLIRQSQPRRQHHSRRKLSTPGEGWESCASLLLLGGRLIPFCLPLRAPGKNPFKPPLDFEQVSCHPLVADLKPPVAHPPCKAHLHLPATQKGSSSHEASRRA